MAQSFGNTRIPFNVDVARGIINDQWALIHKFGGNPSIATSVEDVWDGGGDLPWLTAADSLVVAAGNAADDTAGAGAQQITVQGLDENWDLAEETIELAGESESSATTTTFIRVFRAWVSRAGAYTGNNTADVSIETDTAGTQVARILAGNGQTLMATYSIPRNSTGLILHASASVDTGKTATISWWWRPNGNDVSDPYSGAKRLFHTVTGIAGAYHEDFQAPQVLPAYSDVWVSAVTGSAGGDPVQSDFAILLVPA